MNCPEFEELLTEYADGQAGAENRRLVESHVAACEACRAQLRWTRAMKEAVAGAPAPPMPADLKSLLIQEARQASSRRRAAAWSRRLDWLRPRPLVGIGAAVFAAAALAVLARVTPPAESVSIDDMLLAHRQYELTMPLASREASLSGMADALAAGKP